MHPTPRRGPLTSALLLLELAVIASHAVADDLPVKSVGIVTVVASGQPTTLPTQIPTTMESLSGEQIARSINASDSEDALKYFPSLLVRKRYIGDYNHAILSSRASGTGNSARSAVYADGILLSNYLGNGVGGLSFPPRWGMVAPEEIERVDVMYGPFSAAYPGNSVGAVVVYVTQMPKAFEVHAKAGFSRQPFSLYGTEATYRAWETGAAVGDRQGDWSWRLSFDHADSHGQPLTFATRLLSNGTAGSAGTAVTGAVLNANNANAPWFVLGTGTEYTTTQDQFKARVAYDITPTLRANALLGVWRNEAEGRPLSYLRDAAGQPVYSGPVNIGGLAFTGSQALGGGDFALTDESLTHVMQGLTLKSHTGGEFDWEADWSRYDYRKDSKRQNAGGSPGNPLPGAASGGAGTLADGSGTGWTNTALKGTWRPAGSGHSVDFGAQWDRWTLHYLTSNVAGNWITDPAGTLASEVRGQATLQSLFAQDGFDLAPGWKTVLGLRAEQWTASDGLTRFSPTSSLAYPERRERHLSPKAALSFQARPDLVLKASLGRAVRMPTVAELYGATSTSNSQYINDPDLRPERSWTGELSAEQTLGTALLRVTAFAEHTHDSLYSQTSFDATANKNISRVQNVGRIATRGLELAFNGDDLLLKGLDLQGSLTYADSQIKENAGFVVTAGDTIGKRQPNIPRLRAASLLSWHVDERWTASFGARYSGVQYRTLNNSDVNGHSYQGVSPFLSTDLRLHWKASRQWGAAVGVDNLNNNRYWNFHPYPQRSWSAEMRFDL